MLLRKIYNSEILKPVSKSKPNWLLYGLIIASFSIHVVIFLHMAGIYRSKTLAHIELTMRDISKPHLRDIPRPRLRSKAPDMPKKIRKLTVRKTVVPKFKPLKINTVKSFSSEAPVEKISVPEFPGDTGVKITNWEPGEPVVEKSDYLAPKDYFEMVKFTIDRHKKYPASAKRRRIEGRATVGFVIETDGEVTELEIVKSSRNKALDRAALQALREASPLPAPPAQLFKGPIPIKLTIVFEIT